MLPDRAHMMMLLFVSSANPLWNLLIKANKKEVAIANYIGVSKTTISTWRKGGSIGYNKRGNLNEEVFSEAKKNIDDSKKHDGKIFAKLSASEKRHATSIIDQFEHAFKNSKSFNVYEAGRILGIGVTMCQIVIDDAIYSAYPIFPQLYYSTSARDIADRERDFSKYGGIYFLYVQRLHERRVIWLRCTMRIRYLLKIGSGHVIRCKLNFPILKKLDVKLSCWEYDGFVAVRNQAVFWSFEKREADQRKDYFNFITSQGIQEDGKPLSASGIYLTTGQDRSQSIVTGGVLLQKQGENTIDDHDIREFMHTQWKVIRDKKVHSDLEAEMKRLNNL